MNEGQKAYDIKSLGSAIAVEAKSIANEAKAEVLPIVEKTVKRLAKAVYVSSKAWLKDSATISKTPIDNMVVSFIDHLDSIVLPQIEKVDLDGSKNA